jgi:hypothetical protein
MTKTFRITYALAGWDDNDGTGKPTIIFTVESEDQVGAKRKAPQTTS